MSQPDAGPLLLLGTTRRGARVFRRRLVEAGIREWLALVPEYRRVARLETALDGVAARHPIASDLRAAADVLRRPFLALTAAFARQYQSLAWWASTIGERCTNGSDLFLHCCYVHLAGRHLGGQDGAIVCDDPAVRKAVAALARTRGYRVLTVGEGWPPLRRTALWPVLTLAAKLGVFFLRWLAARRRHEARAVVERSRPEVLISTWVDAGSVDNGGQVQDRFFPGLVEYYATRGIRSATMLAITEGVGTFRQVVRRLAADGRYVVPESWLRLRDLAFPVRLWLSQRGFRFDGATLEGLEVGGLFTAAHRTESLAFAAALQYPLMRRLSEAGLRPSLVVLGFENMVSDKMTILGVRQFMPGAEVAGFCHNPLKRNVLSWYTDRHEAGVAPFPDRVICNGPTYRDILVREHYPAERVVVGSALRYAYLHRAAVGQTPHRAGPPRVLVVLTNKPDATREIVDLVIPVLRGLPDVQVLVRPHPFARGLAEPLVAALGARVRTVDGSMERALAAADVVVCAASGAVLEAVLAGKLVIRVSPELQLDMDPLAWFPEFGPPVTGLGELERRLREVLAGANGSQTPRADVSSLFTPPTEEFMTAFLPSGHGAVVGVR